MEGDEKVRILQLTCAAALADATLRTGRNCLDPMEGMVRGLAPEMRFISTETLWNGSKCRVEVGR